MLYAKRHAFLSAERVIGRFFSFLHPDVWTLLSIAFALASAFSISQRLFGIAGVLLTITAFLDIVDGSVARYTKKATVRGAYLDTVVDRYTEGIVIISLLFAALPEYIFPAPLWIFAYLFGSFITTYAKAALAEKARQEVKGGLLERAERMIILIGGVSLASASVNYLLYTVVALAILTNISALQRVYTGMKSISK